MKRASCLKSVISLVVAVLLLPAPSFADQACLSTSPVAIPDGNVSGVTSTIGISQAAVIQDMNIALQATHTWVGDLIIKLKHVQTGTVVTLLDRMGTTGVGFGCAGNNLDVVLDDEGTGGAIETRCGNPNVPTSPPAYTPNNPLSAFDGQVVTGDWEIFVSDSVSGDVGQLTSFCMQWNSTDVSVGLTPSAEIIAAGSVSPTQLTITNHGPYPAETSDSYSYWPFGALPASLESPRGSSLYTPSGFPYSFGLFTSVRDVLPGETLTYKMSLIFAPIRIVPGPLVDSTVLRIDSSVGSVPRELPNYPVSFDPTIPGGVLSGALATAHDGQAPVPGATNADACEPLVNAAEVAGKIVVVDSFFAPLPEPNLVPPPCGISTQIANVAAAGGRGVLLINATDNAFPMFAPPPPPSFVPPLPALLVGRKFGQALKLGGQITVSVGQAGVWEVFGQAALSGSDDLNPEDNNRYALFVVGKDGDGDRSADAVDGCPQDSSKVAPGVCGCGLADVDPDGDGIVSCVDGCPSDASKSSPGVCGCGVADKDSDGDGISDCVDACPAAGTAESALDMNQNGVSDCSEGPSVTPKAPKLSLKKGKVSVSMVDVPGATYSVSYEVKSPGGKKPSKKMIASSSSTVLLRAVPAGSTVFVSYRVNLAGPSITNSADSPRARIKVKGGKKR